MSDVVRVRFAPSPTGFLHVGGLRTALYNYLFARRSGGRFVLRIEDTDRSRHVPGAVEMIIDSLRWAGLKYDEGPETGGPHAPYFQSERLTHYRDAADRLVASGRAYPCFCTAERLEAMRKDRRKDQQSTKYDRRCLQLPPQEVAAKSAAGEPCVIRMRIPDERAVVVSDIVRGRVEFLTEILDDQILLKSDGYPTYHLANVVDDHLMEITHVIRGEEWLPSTPKHVLLYRHLGWDPPRFAHLPLLLGADRSKLSKRQADVSVSDYRAQGYYPETLVNFVALLGWNPGYDRDFFTLPDLVDEFTLERVNKSGAIFDLEKLRWLNAEYLRRRSPGELVGELKPLLDARGVAGFDDAYLLRVVDLMRERITFVREILEKAGWFFVDPAGYEPETVAKRWRPGSRDLLAKLLASVEAVAPFDAASLEAVVKTFAEREGVKVSDLVHPLRLACTGVGAGPGLYALMETLGREVCVRRIRTALEALK
ncbi:MAG: glutamate--tRNA ligase [Acidobacteriia bacterium]|nr:glutamate--tRNA ligase [Terriglobia bacterium]